MTLKISYTRRFVIVFSEPTCDIIEALKQSNDVLLIKKNKDIAIGYIASTGIYVQKTIDDKRVHQLASKYTRECAIDGDDLQILNDLIDKLDCNLEKKEPSAFGKDSYQDYSIRTMDLINSFHNKSISFERVENATIKIQRLYRKKVRIAQQCHDIPNLIKLNEIATDAETILAKKLINAIYEPYFNFIIRRSNDGLNQLKITPAFLARMIDLSYQLPLLFRSVYHITHKTNLTSILDNGFFGADTLKKKSIKFIRGVSGPADIVYGDQNAICFGPFLIHSNLPVNEAVKLEIDLERMLNDRPMAFFKQTDLHYKPQFPIQELTAKTITLKIQLQSTDTQIQMRFMNKNGNEIGMGTVFKNELIYYNTNTMHAILIQTFFKYLEGLSIGYNNNELIEFLQEVQSFSDEELKAWLIKLERIMANTMEFNIFGSYLNPISIIKEIEYTSNDTKLLMRLDLNDFINKLREGDIAKLNEVKMSLPDIFMSYRFILYLIDVTKGAEQEVITQALDVLLNQCKENIDGKATFSHRLRLFGVPVVVAELDLCGAAEQPVRLSSSHSALRSSPHKAE